MIAPELAQRLIAQSRVKPRLLTGRRVALLAGLTLLVLALAAPNDLAISTPVLSALLWLVMLLMIGLTWRGFAAQKHAAARVSQAQDAAQLRDWTGVEANVVGLLSKPVAPSAARNQALLLAAGLAEHQRQFEASRLIYEELVNQPFCEPGIRYAACLGLAESLLRNRWLTDAVELIDRLRKTDVPAPVRAHFELVCLFREVLMGQSESVIAAAEERYRLFRRYLSTRAAYGYGLLAAGFDAFSRTSQAARLWHDATLLIGTQRLVDRYDVLANVSRKYAAAERPI